MNENDCTKTEMIVKMLHEKKYTLDELAKSAKLPSLSSCLNEMMGRRNKSVEVTAGLADINKATLHKIMARKMNPSRNMLIRLAMALEMTFDETQVLLKSGNCAALSGSRERDIYLIDGIENKKYFDEINAALQEHGLPDLYSKG